MFGAVQPLTIIEAARQHVRNKISTADQTYIGVVQARPESSGAVEALGGDAGGQIFMFRWIYLTILRFWYRMMFQKKA